LLENTVACLANLRPGARNIFALPLAKLQSLKWKISADARKKHADHLLLLSYLCSSQQTYTIHARCRPFICIKSR